MIPGLDAFQHKNDQTVVHVTDSSLVVSGARNALILRPWGPHAGCYITDKTNGDRLLISPEDVQIDKELVRSAIEHFVPEHFAEIILLFPSSFFWQLTLYLNRYRCAVHLAGSNPFLLFIMVQETQFSPSKYGVKDVESLIRYKQKEITGHFNLPATASFAKFLRKIPANFCSFDMLQTILKYWRKSEGRKLLQYLNSPSEAIWDLVIQSPNIDFLKFIWKTFDGKDNSHGYFHISEIVEDYALTSQLAEYTKRIDQLKTIQNEHQLERLLHQCLRDHSYLCKRISSPEGNNFISLLATKEDLAAEGTANNNSLSNPIIRKSFYDNMIQGKCALYKVTAPERCTIVLKENSSSIWELQEVLRPIQHNIHAPDLFTSIETWINLNK